MAQLIGAQKEPAQEIFKITDQQISVIILSIYVLSSLIRVDTSTVTIPELRINRKANVTYLFRAVNKF